EGVLAQRKELYHVGEQSLLPGHSGRRNASLRACEDTTLLRIPKAEFQTILTQRQTLKDLLSRAGHQQVRANMIRTARLARMWALFMFINGFISIGILCGLAKVFRTPFIFPSLGATAFLVFFTPTTPAASPRNTLCGHPMAQAIIINRLTAVRSPFWASVPAPKIGVLAGRGALQRFTRFLWLG